MAESEGSTGDVAIDLAVAIDLKILCEKAVIFSFVVVESVRVLWPSGDLEVDTEWEGSYKGGLIGYLRVGFTNLFI